MATLMVDFNRRKKTKQEIQDEKDFSFVGHPKINKYKYWISGIGCNDFDMPMHKPAPGGHRWTYDKNGHANFYVAVVFNCREELLDVVFLPHDQDETREFGFLVRGKYSMSYKDHKIEDEEPNRIRFMTFELGQHYDEEYCPIKLVQDGYISKQIEEYCKAKEKRRSRRK